MGKIIMSTLFKNKREEKMLKIFIIVFVLLNLVNISVSPARELDSCVPYNPNRYYKEKCFEIKKIINNDYYLVQLLREPDYTKNDILLINKNCKEFVFPNLFPVSMHRDGITASAFRGFMFKDSMLVLKLSSWRGTNDDQKIKKYILYVNLENIHVEKIQFLEKFVFKDIEFSQFYEVNKKLPLKRIDYDEFFTYDKILEYIIPLQKEIKFKTILYKNIGKPSKMYLIKGDLVSILDEKIDIKGQKWFLINYKGKKNITAWIKEESVTGAK